MKALLLERRNMYSSGLESSGPRGRRTTTVAAGRTDAFGVIAGVVSTVSVGVAMRMCVTLRAMVRVFMSQNCIDRWHATGGIAIAGDLLRFHAVPYVTLFINPSVYFERIDGGEADPYDIIGAVKTAQELAQMGAEHWENSVVLSDFAYTVKPGFVATPVGDDGSPVILDGGRWSQLVGAMEALGVA
jgi:hypothetical protein